MQAAVDGRLLRRARELTRYRASARARAELVCELEAGDAVKYHGQPLPVRRSV